MAVVRQLGQEIESVSRAVALYTNALTALEKREFDRGILEDLVHPPPQLAEFSAAFRRLADRILTTQRQQEEMASAALIQRSFLPKEPRANIGNSDFEIRTMIRPAREVGGDFYDFFMLDQDRLAIVIGDVCGKGIPASIFMTVVVTTLRTAAREEFDPASTIERTNWRDQGVRLRAIVLVLDAGALKQQRLVRLRLEISGIAPLKMRCQPFLGHLPTRKPP